MLVLELDFSVAADAVFAKLSAFLALACMVSELFNATFQEAVNNGMGCK